MQNGSSISVYKLAVAIIHQARLDWQDKRANQIYSRDLLTFFHSPWFEDLCFLVGHHPDDARRHLNISRIPEPEEHNPSQSKTNHESNAC